jgi:Na(+)-translocating NADH:ubiquinone oxidoreductase B subunit
MKPLLRVMDRLRPTFHDGRLRLLRPAYDAIDFFLFSIPLRTEAAPHVRDPMNVKRYMSAVIVAVMPCIAAATYLFGWRILAMIVLTYVVGLSIELFFAIVRKEEINEGFFVTGLLYPLILPPGLPLWMVAVGVAFGVVVGKELFGGTGRNLFNPALVGRCFLLIGYPTAMSSGWSVPQGAWPGRLGQWAVDAVSGATPLAAAKQGQFAGAWDLLIGNVAGSAGATSSLLILLAGVFLLVTGTANWRTIAATLGSFVLVGGLMGALHWAAPERFASFGPSAAGLTAPGWMPGWLWGVCHPLARIFGGTGWHVLAGGLLFGAVFMATDPVSTPITKSGKWFYGAIIGTSTVLIRHLTGYVEGVMFAILLGNIAAPLLDDVATRLYLRRMQHEG